MTPDLLSGRQDLNLQPLDPRDLGNAVRRGLHRCRRGGL